MKKGLYHYELKFLMWLLSFKFQFPRERIYYIYMDF